VRDDLAPVALLHLGRLGHVIVVVMRQQQVRYVDAMSLDLLVERLHRTPRIDQNAIAAGCACDQVGVGHELWVKRAFEQHGRQPN
jgi:hypothetical protein